MPMFSQIPKVSRAGYMVNIPWDYLACWLGRHKDMALDMNPMYQRGYVWTHEQKINYLEFILKGGTGGRDIYWNCPGWMAGFKGPLELVDGKQRISAVLGFLDNKIEVFGSYFLDYEDALSNDVSFNFHINNLSDRKDVVQWYIDMNTGGSVHTDEDLRIARELVE